MMLAALALPWLARAQSEADAPAEIAVHPGVTTVVHLPDTIEHVRLTAPAAGMVRATNIANLLIMRPRRGLSAETNIWVDVKTETMSQRFRLRVVRRAKDADRKILVLATEPTRDAEESTRAAEEPAQPAPRVPPVPPVTAEPATEPAGAITGAPRFELALHAVVALPGFTALTIQGYEAHIGRQLHGILGLRLTAERPGAGWALEANVNWEWPAGPMKYDNNPAGKELEVSGPLLRAEVGARARGGTIWIPSAYGGIGGQTQLRRTVRISSDGRSRTSNTMNDGLVLVLGMGLHRRVHNVVLGVDFQVRRGGPDDYRSVTVFWTVGYFLDQGD
jgi:hypothetical protein